MPFIIKSLSIPEILLIEPQVFGDGRGFFMETYQANDFSVAGIPTHFVQDNHSGSHQGTLRGLHYQINHAQGKLVRVIIGEVFDVAVDLRHSSSTFGKWIGINLSAENHLMTWIPVGFAHGFYVLSPWAEIVYKTTDFYDPPSERTLLWNDPQVAIEWPIMKDKPLKISPKDDNGKTLSEVECF